MSLDFDTHDSDFTIDFDTSTQSDSADSSPPPPSRPALGEFKSAREVRNIENDEKLCRDCEISYATPHSNFCAECFKSSKMDDFDLKSQFDAEEQMKLEGTFLYSVAGFFVRHPCIVMCAAILPCLAMMIVAGFFSFELDNGEGFQLKEHIVVERWDAMRLASDETFFNSLEIAENQEIVREREQSLLTIVLTIEAEVLGQSVFDAPNARAIKDLLQNLTTLEGYDDFCQLRYDVNGTALGCEPAAWMGRWLFGKRDNATGFISQYDVADQRDKLTLVGPPEQVMDELYAIDGIRAFMDNVVDRQFSEFYYRSTVTKIFLTFGGPLSGFDNVDDRPAEQKEIFGEWAKDGLRMSLNAAANETLSAFFVDEVLTSFELDIVINSDSSFAGGAVIFVFLIMWWHTGSSFLAGLGMIHILTSFPVAYFVFRVLFGIKQLSMMIVLAVYIVLGIGADDVFIIVDTFKQSRLLGKSMAGDLQARLAWSMQRSVVAISITSLSTSSAFAVNAISLVPPIRTFGLFTAFLVIANWLLCLTWFNAVVVLWAQWFEGKTLDWRMARRRARKEDLREPEKPGDVELQRMFDASLKHRKKTDEALKFVDDDNAEEGYEHDIDEPIDVSRHGALPRFFHNTFVPFINRFRLVVIGLFVVITGVAAIVALGLTSSEDPTKWFPDDYPLQRALTLDRLVFKEPVFATILQFPMGVLPADRSRSDLNNITDLGVVHFDADFGDAVRSSAGQLAVQDLCDRVRELPLVKDGQVLCFAELFAQYVEHERNGTQFPVPQDQFDALVRDYADCSSTWCLEQRLQFANFERMFGFARESLSSVRNGQDSDEWQGRPKRVYEKGDLLFLQVIANTTLPDFLPDSTARPLFNALEEFVDTWNDEAITGLHIFQSAVPWLGMEMDATLQRTAAFGIIVSLTLSSIILLATTGNLIVAAFAILTIVCITVAFLGLIVSIGWTLGIIESISLSILVGLCVDYCAHIAIAYTHAHAHSRLQKMRIAMVELGTSIFFAALTTLGAAFLLFFTVIQIFAKYGLFIFMAIGLSFLYCFFFFTALCLTFGPQGTTGDVKQIFSSIAKSTKRVKKEKW